VADPNQYINNIFFLHQPPCPKSSTGMSPTTKFITSFASVHPTSSLNIIQISWLQLAEGLCYAHLFSFDYCDYNDRSGFFPARVMVSSSLAVSTPVSSACSSVLSSGENQARRLCRSRLSVFPSTNQLMGQLLNSLGMRSLEHNGCPWPPLNCKIFVDCFFPRGPDSGKMLLGKRNLIVVSWSICDAHQSSSIYYCP
jgi:hypothetical protein